MTEEVNIPDGFKLCECNCGELIKIGLTTAKKPRRFKNGHNINLPGHKDKMNDKRPRLINHYKWKGGRRINDQGYILIYKPDHPRATKNNGYVREHDLIMEEMLGRPLEQHEIVHHMNGNKQDNRIENLELTDRSKHQNIHRIKDMSDRQCYECKSRKTWRRRWYTNRDVPDTIILCNNCYDKQRRRIRKNKHNTQQQTLNQFSSV